MEPSQQTNKARLHLLNLSLAEQPSQTNQDLENQNDDKEEDDEAGTQLCFDFVNQL